MKMERGKEREVVPLRPVARFMPDARHNAAEQHGGCRVGDTATTLSEILANHVKSCRPLGQDWWCQQGPLRLTQFRCYTY